ncbi:group II truncated hemoglobin [Bradyrhizobium ivorense]|uniref:group II truncated hemoglobin n=1 Tax=Bradyrhizobium ivorense TaxID=2511166 RepID=UPI003D31942D
MSPDHPERVAAWLSEVFGGPRFYTERYGGYRRMVSQHIGKEIRPEQRALWATYMVQSADDAGLPSDPEFRAAFVAYIEWGSRIALENSGPSATPPPNMRCRAGGGSATRRRARGRRPTRMTRR